MHELSIMTGVLEIALEYAQKNSARKINKIFLQIGAMSDVLPEWAQSYFDMLSKDTIAEQASLEIEKIPIRTRCNICGRETTFTNGEWQFTCPACGGGVELLSGRELKIHSIEID